MQSSQQVELRHWCTSEWQIPPLTPLPQGRQLWRWNEVHLQRKICSCHVKLIFICICQSITHKSILQNKEDILHFCSICNNCVFHVPFVPDACQYSSKWTIVGKVILNPSKFTYVPDSETEMVTERSAVGLAGRNMLQHAAGQNG